MRTPSASSTKRRRARSSRVKRNALGSLDTNPPLNEAIVPVPESYGLGGGRCDICGLSFGTLYQVGTKLVCYGDSGFDGKIGGVFKAARAAVTGAENIRRRRNAMNRRAA